MKKFSFALYVSIFFVGVNSNFSFSQKAPSLKEVLDSALVNDYSYENKQLSLKITELDRERLNDVYMPKLEFSAKEAYAYAASNLTTPAFSTAMLPLPITLPVTLGIPEHENRYKVDNFITQADLKASFVLFAGGKVGYLKKANEYKLEAEKALLTTDRNAIIQNVSAVYDQLAMLKQMKLMLDESQTRLNANLKTATAALENGLITQYDYNKIKLAQAQLASKYKEYEGKRKLVIINLNVLTKISIERLQLIDQDIETIAVSLVDAPQNRHELSALESAVKANEYKVKAAKTWWIPKVGASASLGYLGLHDGRLRSEDPLLTTQKPLDYSINNFSIAPLFTAGVGLKWDLFDGREGITDTKRAKLDLQIAQNKLADVSEKVLVQLEKNKVELDIANNLLEVKEIALQIAQNSLNQSTKEYELGLIKSTELLDSENDFQQATLEYNQAIFQQRRAALNYLEAAGGLNIDNIK